jgi:hypothetical protein
MNVHDATSSGTQASCTQHPLSPSGNRRPSCAANSAGTNLLQQHSAREPRPQRVKYTPQNAVSYIPHKHSTNNTTHPFPLITYAGRHQPVPAPAPAPAGAIAAHIAQLVVQTEQLPEGAEAGTGNTRKLTDKITSCNRPTTKQRTNPTSKKRTHCGNTGPTEQENIISPH